jgi:hypothetical protein
LVAELVDEHLDLSRVRARYTEGRGAAPYDDTSGDWDLDDARRDTEAENVLSVEQLAHFSEATTNWRFS